MSAKTDKIMRQLASSIREGSKPKTSPYDTTATVRRVEGGTAWVHIPGGVDETPVKLTISAKPGDAVQVRVTGGRAFLIGNATAPPTDDTTAVKAVTQISAVSRIVQAVKGVAERTARIAGNTAQYFWHTETGTDTGVHITEIPQEEFLADPENGGGNLLARSNGVAVRDGLTELATFSANGSRLGNDTGFATEQTPTGLSFLIDNVSHAEATFNNSNLVLENSDTTSALDVGADLVYRNQTGERFAVASDGTIRTNGSALFGGASWAPSAGVSVASGAWSAALDGYTFQLSAGMYLVAFGADFSSNATGYRMVQIKATSTGAGGNRYTPTARAVDGNNTRLSGVIVLTPTASTEYAMYAYQNSGAALTVAPWLNIIRLK